MSPDVIFYLCMGAMAGGFINGFSGTGTALFALGFYLVVLDPVRSVAIVALLAVLVGLQGLWIVRKSILDRPKRTLRFVVPGLIGVPLGVGLLNVIDASVLRLSIAVFLIVYGVYFGFRANLPSFSRPAPLADAGVGLIGGVLGGAASVSGAIPQMWLSLRPWKKAEVRAVLQPFNGAVLGTTVGMLFWGGAYDRLAVTALLITIPIGFISAQVGIMAFRRVSDTSFRRLLILITMMMGLGILASEVA